MRTDSPNNKTHHAHPLAHEELEEWANRERWDRLQPEARSVVLLILTRLLIRAKVSQTNASKEVQNEQQPDDSSRSSHR